MFERGHEIRQQSSFGLMRHQRLESRARLRSAAIAAAATAAAVVACHGSLQGDHESVELVESIQRLHEHVELLGADILVHDDVDLVLQTVSVDARQRTLQIRKSLQITAQLGAQVSLHTHRTNKWEVSGSLLHLSSVLRTARVCSYVLHQECHRILTLDDARNVIERRGEPRAQLALAEWCGAAIHKLEQGALDIT